MGIGGAVKRGVDQTIAVHASVEEFREGRADDDVGNRAGFAAETVGGDQLVVAGRRESGVADGQGAVGLSGYISKAAAGVLLPAGTTAPVNRKPGRED